MVLVKEAHRNRRRQMSKLGSIRMKSPTLHNAPIRPVQKLNDTNRSTPAELGSRAVVVFQHTAQPLAASDL
jgi:hypothetical protein